MRILVLVLILGGCSSPQPWVVLNDKKIWVEVEDKPANQRLGMMFRTELPEDHGMLFVFPSATMRSFWMKNTKIPLDILYFDAQLKLVTLIEEAKPCVTPQCPSYPSTAPARYVLEINGGLARQWGVRLGDELILHLGDGD